MTVFNHKGNGSCSFDWLWLRIVKDGTTGEWKDPDNKENLNFKNFNPFQGRVDMTGWGENHAVMTCSGKWMYESKFYDTYSPHVLCELT